MLHCFKNVFYSVLFVIINATDANVLIKDICSHVCFMYDDDALLTVACFIYVVIVIRVASTAAVTTVAAATS